MPDVSRRCLVGLEGDRDNGGTALGALPSSTIRANTGSIRPNSGRRMFQGSLGLALATSAMAVLAPTRTNGGGSL